MKKNYNKGLTGFGFLLLLLLLNVWPNYANCQPTSKQKNGKEQLITVPSNDFETVIDAGFKAQDLAVDVNYWMERAKKAERELVSFRASQVNSNYQLSEERSKNTLLVQNNTLLKQQNNRLKKDKRFSIGPFAGMAISQGAMPHPAVGIGLSFGLVRFGRF